MLLGLDFMRKHEVLVNIPEIRVGDIIISMVKYDGNSKTAEVEVCINSVTTLNNCECPVCITG